MEKMNKETVILVHGFCENSKVWDIILPKLRNDFRYLVPDLPVAGEKNNAGEVSMATYANYIHGIIEKEKTGKVIVLGHSMGGYITLEFANLFPDTYHAIGLIHSHPYADDENKKQNRRRTIEFIKTNGALPYINEFVPALFSDVSKKSYPIIVNRQIDSVKNTSAELLIESLTAMIGRNDHAEFLSEMREPVLFLLGRMDTVIPLQTALRAAQQPRRSMIEILNDSAHMGMIEEPVLCARHINDFLEFVKAG